MWHEGLKKRDMLVQVDERRWVPLHPFSQTVTCNECKADEIFFVDKWDGRSAVLKSSGRGHTLDCRETWKDMDNAMPANKGD
jgi:hypothetical protein